MSKIESGEVLAESQYVPMSNADIKSTALRLLGGSAFGSWQIREYDMHLLPVIFLPLTFISPIQIKEMERDGIVHFIGDIDDSVARSINGYPCFTSMRYVNVADLTKLQKCIDALMALEMDDEA